MDCKLGILQTPNLQNLLEGSQRFAKNLPRHTGYMIIIHTELLVAKIKSCIQSAL